MRNGIHHTAEIGGISLDFVSKAEVPHLIQKWRRADARNYVVLMNPHSAMMCRRDIGFKTAVDDAALTLPDGVGMIVGAAILGHGRRYRVTGPALMLHLCDEGRALGLRHYFYGGRPGVAERLSERLLDAYPGLQIAGMYSPPFRELGQAEDADAVQRINDAKPDVVWVGIGAPKQEKWMAGHVGRISATALIGVGAAFDFHSGDVPWAPNWVRKMGCEWAYRLAIEPRRLWRRNLDSPLFLARVFQQLAGNALSQLVRIKTTAVETALDAVEEDFPTGSGGAAVASSPAPFRAAGKASVAGRFAGAQAANVPAV